jgi:hypothetical protein
MHSRREQEERTYRNIDARLVRVQSGCASRFDAVHQKIQEFGAVDWTLTNLFAIIDWDRHDVCAGIISPKGYPDAISTPSNSIHGIADADGMEQLRSIHTNSNTGTNFLVLCCLLVDVDFDTLTGTVMVQREGGTQSPNATADNGYPKGRALRTHSDLSAWQPRRNSSDPGH